MVKRKLQLPVLVTLCLTVSIGNSAHAQGESILEKMQNEVASIAERMRKAVVTIEDEGALTVAGSPLILSSPFSSLPEEILVLQTEEKRLNAQIQTMQAERVRVTTKFKAGLVTKGELDAIDGKIKDAEINRQGLLERIDLKKRNLSLWNLTYRQDIFLDTAKSRNTLSDQLLKAENRYREYTKTYGNDHPQLREAKKEMDELQKRAEELKRSNEAIHVWQEAKDNKMGRQGDPFQVIISTPQQGSGFSIGEDFIVTTSDVLVGMKNPVVVTDNGTRIKARIVGNNRDLNVGLLRLNAKVELGSLKMGDSASVKPGHFGVSMSNQNGQPNGVVFTLIGDIRNEGTYAGNQFYPSLIQIAGSVGTGTSGAPLMNVRGEVIGMITTIPISNVTFTSRINTLNGAVETKATPSSDDFVNPLVGGSPQEAPLFATRPNGDSVQGLLFSSPSSAPNIANYAIPINQIKNIVEELRSEKPIVRGWIGIAPEDVVATIDKKGIILIDRSVRISAVYPESPAYIAGVQPGDIVATLNDKPLRNAGDIRELSLRLKKGDTVSLTIRRPKETRKIILNINARPATIKPPITVPVKDSF